jgi:hypothetical protein
MTFLTWNMDIIIGLCGDVGLKWVSVKFQRISDTKQMLHIGQLLVLSTDGLQGTPESVPDGVCMWAVSLEQGSLWEAAEHSAVVLSSVCYTASVVGVLAVPVILEEHV